MSASKFSRVTLLLLLVFWGLCASMYLILPEQVPIHWNIQGEVDRYGHKYVNTLILPLLPLATYVLMTITPRIDPSKDNYKQFKGSYVKIRTALVLLMVGVVLLVNIAALGYNVDVDLIIRIMIPVLFIYIGIYLGKIKHNYFIGIRTPWTLASEEVWVKTHRLGSKLLVVGGILALSGVLLTPVAGFILLILGILIPTIFSAVYSYLLYTRSVNTRD